MFAEISRLDEVLKDLRETVYDEDDVAHVNEIDALAETKVTTIRILKTYLSDFAGMAA